MRTVQESFFPSISYDLDCLGIREVLLVDIHLFFLCPSISYNLDSENQQSAICRKGFLKTNNFSLVIMLALRNKVCCETNWTWINFENHIFFDILLVDINFIYNYQMDIGF